MADAPYLAFVGKDLGDIVERVVPDTREGVLNLKSARQVSYRIRTFGTNQLTMSDIRQLASETTSRSADSG